MKWEVDLICYNIKLLNEKSQLADQRQANHRKLR